MKWLEIIIKSAGGDIDALCLRLEEMGVSGLIIEDEDDFRGFLEHSRAYWDYVDRELEEKFAGLSRVKFYAADDFSGRELLARVHREFSGLTDCSLIDDEDWENNWREFYKPIEIGDKLIIVPEWDDSSEGRRLPVRLDPGLMFGTGSHATTRMCLELLETSTAGAARVLDLGCGSGILGIAALRLGADSVLGCDIDPKAPDIACANASLNGFDEAQFRVLAGNILTDAALRRELGADYDIVLCNIVADVIVPLAQHIPGFLRPGGTAIFSGVIKGREGEVSRSLLGAGFDIEETLSSEDWYAFLCRKPQVFAV